MTLPRGVWYRAWLNVAVGGVVLWIVGALIMALLPAIAGVGAIIVTIGKIEAVVGAIALAIVFLRSLF